MATAHTGIAHLFTPTGCTDVRTQLESMHLESAITVSGVVRARPADMVNPEQATGAVELLPSAVRQHSTVPAALPVPVLQASMQRGAAADSSRLAYRYLDMRDGPIARNLRVRSAVTHALRSALHEQDFVEVETPTLFRSTPEGAREFLVPTRSPGTVYALTQSPQQYKQLLMVGGMQKYFQVARCYRDEAGRSDRQPEFTQLDLEMSWVTSAEVRQLGTQLLRTAVQAAAQACRKWAHQAPIPSSLSCSLPDTPLDVLSYATAVGRYGVDRPDRRIPSTIHDASHTLATNLSDFAPWAAALGALKGGVGGQSEQREEHSLASLGPRVPSVRVLCVPSGATALSRKVLDGVLHGVSARCATVGSNSGAAGGGTGNSPTLVPARVPASPGPWTGSSLGKVLPQQAQDAVQRVTGAAPGDLLVFAAGFGDYPCKLLGMARLALSDAMGGVPSDAPMDPLWVTGFPMFELASADEDASVAYRGGGSRLKAAHHPFTAPHPEHSEQLWSALERISAACSAGDDALASSLREDCLSITSDAYDLVVNGSELGGGSIRIHDAGQQRAVLQHALGLGAAQVASFDHLLGALSHGAPPHGGIALGLDRTLSVLLGTQSVRDVIAFPKSAGGRDAMTGAPSPPTAEQMAEYHFSWAGSAATGSEESR